MASTMPVGAVLVTTILGLTSDSNLVTTGVPGVPMLPMVIIPVLSLLTNLLRSAVLYTVVSYSNAVISKVSAESPCFSAMVMILNILALKLNCVLVTSIRSPACRLMLL